MLLARFRMSSALALCLGTLSTIACSSDDAGHDHGLSEADHSHDVADGHDAYGAQEAGCSVTRSGDDAVVTCGEMSVTLMAPPAPEACTIAEADGSIFLTCGDVTTEISLTPPSNMGAGGAPAAPTAPCSFEELSDKVVLTCGDESVDIPIGGDAMVDGVCVVEEVSPGLTSITCPGSGAVSVTTCLGLPLTCDGNAVRECLPGQGWMNTACTSGNTCTPYDGGAYCAGGGGGMGGQGGAGGMGG